MRLDAHHSFSDRYPLAVLDTILKRNRFDGSVLVSAEIPSPLPEFVRAIVFKTDRIDAATLDEHQRHPLFRGVCGRSGDFAELQRRGLTLDFPDGPAAVPAIAERCPQLRIVIDRLGSPAELAAAARYPNVFCKLAGVIGVPHSDVHHAIAIFGPERLMFGSDWPWRLPEHAWKASLAAFTQALGARTIEFREQILGGTAARFYGIAA